MTWRLRRDRGIGREAGDGKFFDVAAKHAGPQQAPGNVVEPKALAQLMQVSSGLHVLTSVAPRIDKQPPRSSRKRCSSFALSPQQS